jgi:signal transduction histidine kinase
VASVSLSMFPPLMTHTIVFASMARFKAAATGAAPAPSATTRLRSTSRRTAAAVDLPAGLELAAYRLIQEALTNVRKHAPTSRTQVRLCYEPDHLRIEVSDDGGPSGAVRDTAPDTSGLGHGLIGMRERVQLYDGRMQAGPLPGGGFRVEAVLPLSVAAS